MSWPEPDFKEFCESWSSVRRNAFKHCNSAVGRARCARRSRRRVKLAMEWNLSFRFKLIKVKSPNLQCRKAKIWTWAASTVLYLKVIYSTSSSSSYFDKMTLFIYYWEVWWFFWLMGGPCPNLSCGYCISFQCQKPFLLPSNSPWRYVQSRRSQSKT